MKPLATAYEHPLFSEALRPFFLLAALQALFGILPWSLLLHGMGDWTLGMTAAQWSQWSFLHRYELLFGMGGAALAGFLLSVEASWTGSAAVRGRPLLWLAVLWIFCRIAAFIPPGLDAWGVGAALLLLSHLGFTLILCVRSTLTMGLSRNSRHRIFPLLVLALAGVQAAALTAWMGWLKWPDATPDRWLNLALNIYLMLILAALGRISMVVVNEALETCGLARDYLARPPLRNLATLFIALHCLALACADAATAGWLALAAACAVLNITNDWHRSGVPRVLHSAWVWPLYGIYWLMAAGLALLGAAGLELGLAVNPADARHLLTVGVVGGAILAVLRIAGRRHTGQPFVATRDVSCAFAMIALAALLRGLGPLFMPHRTPLFWALAGALWCGAFALYLWRDSAFLLFASELQMPK